MLRAAGAWRERGRDEMSGNETVEVTEDGTGQPLRVGDLVAAVRLDPTHTVRGTVVRLGKVTCAVRVSWVSDPDPGLGTYATARRARVGEEARVYLARTFVVAHARGPGEVPGPLAQGERRRVQLARALGAPEGEDWLELLVQVVKLRVQAERETEGLTDERGSVLNRVAVRDRYLAALDASFGVSVSRAEALSAMVNAVMHVRDRELRMLRQRLALAVEVHRSGLDLPGEGERENEGVPTCLAPDGCRWAADEVTRLGEEMRDEGVRRACRGCGRTGDTWFDRSVCAEPCGSMHERCVSCGVSTRLCPNDPNEGARGGEPG